MRGLPERVNTVPEESRSVERSRVPLDVRLRILGGQSAAVRWAFRRGLRWRDQLLRVVQSRYVAQHGRFVELESDGGRLGLDLTSFRDFRLFLRLRRGKDAEAATTALLRRYLHSGDVCVDAGANNGIVTLVAGKQVGPTGRVYAFEPHPATYARLTANIERNRLTNVVAFNVGLSDHSGRAELFTALDDGQNSLHAGGESKTEVRLEALDGILPETRVDFVKIDVEGSELAALRGMSSCLSRNPHLCLLVEWNRDYASVELFEFLSQRFEVEIVHESGSGAWTLERVSSPIGFPSLCNLWCTPAGRTRPAADSTSSGGGSADKRRTTAP